MKRIIYRLWMQLTAARRKHRWVHRGVFPRVRWDSPMICCVCGKSCSSGDEDLQINKLGCRGYEESP